VVNRESFGWKDGKPNAPGRLNDLRHIIYKTFDESVSASVRGLGIMALDRVLKENVDGEALIWAYTRLCQEDSDTKILFMFTDGSPTDDSTLSVQRGDFLKVHFEHVVEQIVAEKRIMLRLIGIDHDLSDLSPDAVNVTNLKLARPVLNTLM
jgi:cobaltochelatase CobT